MVFLRLAPSLEGCDNLPFDLVGFTELTPGTGLVPLAGALGDNIYQITGDDLKLKKDARLLIGAFCCACSTGENYRFRQASLEIDHQFQKIALNADLDPSQGHEHLFARPLPLVADEALNALIQNATDEEALVGAMISTQPISQNVMDSVRPTHQIIGVSDTTLTAKTWTLCTITWDQVLPRGEYLIVGMRAGIYSSVTSYMGLARVVIPANNDWRPGVPCAVMEADHEEYQSVTNCPWHMWPKMQGGGKGGIVFDENHMPNVEFLKIGNCAVADENVELLLQKIK